VSSSSMAQIQSFVAEAEELKAHSQPMKKPCLVDHDWAPMRMRPAGSKESSRSQDPLFRKQQRIYISEDAQHGAIETRLAGLCQLWPWRASPAVKCLHGLDYVKQAAWTVAAKNRSRCRALEGGLMLRGGWREGLWQV